MKGLLVGAVCLVVMRSAHAGLGHDDYENFATTITKITMVQNEAAKFTESNIHRVHRALRGPSSGPRVLRGHTVGPHLTERYR
jgi:hypothetical protein